MLLSVYQKHVCKKSMYANLTTEITQPDLYYEKKQSH